MAEWAVFYRPVSAKKEPVVVAHVFVSAENAEDALKAGEKAVGKKGKCFQVDRSPEWSVDKT